ncbi:hypothetical protein ACT8ZV_05135 [Nocardioides sp. MAHUQ-72]|uniref:hypothetical protein n=1 Tax=unclassified Nocardioides TaxID=2615069 RepID=UPI003618951D
MTAAWVAGSVRARSMTRRRLGRAGVRRLASEPSLDDALVALARSPYRRDVRPGSSLAAAQRAVHDTLVWNVRVLGGWVPREGAALLRVLLAPFEIADVADHLRRLRGEDVWPPYELGSLGTAWPRLAAAGDAAGVRRALATSAWGDPGGEAPEQVVWAMRLSLADRAIAVAPETAPWAAGAVALLLARALTLEHPDLTPGARLSAARVVGPAAASATTLGDLVPALSRVASWALHGVATGTDLWAAERRWWARVETDAAALARSPRPGPAVVLGAVALLAVDAWRVRAALEVAARPDASVDALEVGVGDALA